jgi:hypothetical protein
MVGYCICGIFRKPQHPAPVPKLLTLIALVSIHGGGYHIWEVTSSEVAHFLKVCVLSSCVDVWSLQLTMVL